MPLHAVVDQLKHLPPRLAQWAAEFAVAGEAYHVDPFLLAAVCDRESLGGEALTPKGPHGTGDHGHGRGLMQIDDRAHPGWLFTHEWQNPAQNILYGALILGDGLRVFKGHVGAALAAYNAGPNKVRRTLTATQDQSEDEQLAALDRITTGGDYASDVMRRCTSFKVAALKEAA